MTPPRQPGYDAVYELISAWGLGASMNGYIWRAVEAFGDAMGLPGGNGEES